MIHSQLSVPIVMLGAAALIASCSSSTAGTGTAAGSLAAGSGSNSDRPSAARSTGSVAMPSDAAGLTATLTKGLQSTKSLHLDLAVTAAGRSITGSGDESLADGQLTAADFTETFPTVGDIEIVIVDSQVYAKLPASLQAGDTSGKPWVVADPNSTNPVAKELGQTTGSIVSQSSIGSYNAFASAATSVKIDGTDQVNGAAATHYSVVVDVTKLPADNASKATLIAAGLTSVPVEMWVDAQGRVVQLTEAFAVSGQQTSTKVTISKFGEPVTITAPPADQVASG